MADCGIGGNSGYVCRLLVGKGQILVGGVVLTRVLFKDKIYISLS